MEENSPIKNRQTSKVIDTLHTEIDNMRSEMERLRTSSDSHRAKYEREVRKNESYIDQLANAKHESDMINALLKRKERRVIDLEEQLTELTSTVDKLSFTNKNIKIRYDNLQESTASSIAEYERMKIAYDSLNASQLLYKRHYEAEIKSLTESFYSLKDEMVKNYETMLSKFEVNEKDVETLLDSLINKRKSMDILYATKNKTAIDLLKNLAISAKLHGEESKLILNEVIENNKVLSEKFPDLDLKLNEHEEINSVIDQILYNDNENSFTFEDEITSNAVDPQIDSLKVHSEDMKQERVNSKKAKGKKYIQKTGPKEGEEEPPTSRKSSGKKRNSSGPKYPKPQPEIMHDVLTNSNSNNRTPSLKLNNKNVSRQKKKITMANRNASRTLGNE